MSEMSDKTHILITGGTGFIGSRLTQFLYCKGYSITILTRDKSKVTNAKAIEDLSEFNENKNIDAIINLSGAPISKRWTKEYKQTLITSRVKATNEIIELIKRLKTKPKILISASAIGYYGSQDGVILDETSKPKDEFTHRLCKEWEDSAKAAEDLGVRLCIARLGVVLGKNGGALKQMIPSFKAALGGKIGGGEQYFSWVHIDDVINAFDFMISNKKASGIYNITAPNAVANKEFTKSLGQHLKRPTIFTMPSFVIKTLFGEMGEALLLKGQNVKPNHLLKDGFKFQYPKLDSALSSILGK